MRFSETSCTLQENEMNENIFLRDHFKLLLNAGLGKSAQKNFSTAVKYVHSEEELLKLWESAEITNIEAVGENVCQVHIKEDDEKTNYKTNSILYAFITARTRIYLHRTICTLRKSNFHVYYCDSDSIIFSGPKDCNPPLPMGASLGDFKEELGSNSNIIEFSCLGRKNYKIQYEKEGCPETLFKIAGISLKSAIAKSIVTNHYPAPQKLQKASIPQIRNVKQGLFQRRQEKRSVNVKNNIRCQRIPLEDTRMSTKPWGFKKKLQ